MKSQLKWWAVLFVVVAAIAIWMVATYQKHVDEQDAYKQDLNVTLVLDGLCNQKHMSQEDCQAYHEYARDLHYDDVLFCIDARPNQDFENCLEEHGVVVPYQRE